MKFHCQDHQLTLASEAAIYEHGCPLSVIRLGPIIPPFNNVVRAYRMWRVDKQPPYLRGIRRAWTAGDQVAVCDKAGYRAWGTMGTDRDNGPQECELHILNGTCACGSYGIYDPLVLIRKLSGDMQRSSSQFVMGVCLYWGVVAEDGETVRATRSRVEAMYCNDGLSVSPKAIADHHQVPVYQAEYGVRMEERWSEEQLSKTQRDWLDAVAFLDEGLGVTYSMIQELIGDASMIPPNGSVTYAWSNHYKDRAYKLTNAGAKMRETGKVQKQLLGRILQPYCSVPALTSIRDQLSPPQPRTNAEVMNEIDAGHQPFHALVGRTGQTLVGHSLYFANLPAPPRPNKTRVVTCEYCNVPQRLEYGKYEFDCLYCNAKNEL